jgi:hypothetical protein
MPPSHTLFCNLDMQQKIDFHDLRLSEPKLMPKVDEAFEKNEWIRAEIKFKYTDMFHLYFKEENNVDSIRFTNPYRKRKLDELEHTNNSLSQFQPLLKNQRLLDVEVELQYRMSFIIIYLIKLNNFLDLIFLFVTFLNLVINLIIQHCYQSMFDLASCSKCSFCL